jgi:hypothetical protein
MCCCRSRLSSRGRAWLLGESPGGHGPLALDVDDGAAAAQRQVVFCHSFQKGCRELGGVGGEG